MAGHAAPHTASRTALGEAVEPGRGEFGLQPVIDRMAR